MAGGIQFDFVGTDKGVVKTFEQIQVSIRKTASTIEELGTKGQHPIDSLSNQIASLQIALANNDRAINASRAALKKFAEEAKEALEAGDFSKFNAKQTDYSDELENLRELIAETSKYKQALEDLTTVGVVNKEGTSLFFATEYDFRMMKQAKEKVAELQEQIGKFQGSDEDLTTLRESLSEANDELRKAEDKARDAAEALGGKLGAKAAETSERLYEVNDAVKKQSKIVDDLTDAYNEAVRAVNALEGSNDIAAREQAVNNYEMLAEQLQNAENHLVNLKNQQKEAQTEWDKTNKEIESQNSIITKLCGGQEKLNEIMSNLPAPLNKAITGLQGMTGAAKAFIATPLGVVLAALIIAWETLTQWFERSEEGQMALAKVTGYFTGILEVLKDTAASVGEFLYKMFTDPIEAGKSFVSFLKGQVVNRLKAVGDIGFAIGKILSAAFSDTPLENMKQGYKDLTNAVLQLGSGVEKPLEKMGKAIENIGKKANESAQIAYDEKMLEREEHKTKRLIAEEEKRARELRTKRGKRTKEEEKELKNIEKKITDAELGIINKKIALQERSMANSKYDSIEENNKLDDLYAEKARIEGRNNQRLAQIEMQGLSGRNQQTKKLLDTQAKIREDAFKHEDELAKKKIASQRAQEDAVIAAIKDDAERERKEREVQYKRTIEDLKAKEEDIYKQIYQQRKAAYETANKDKKYANTDEGAAGWKGLKVRTLQEVQDLEFTILAELGKSGIINTIEEQFGKGNVDLIARPLIDAAELVKKGWKDAGDGIATVFSSQYGIEDKEGKVHEILVTPILPDGTVLSETELKKYLDTTLQGADDILKADNLGIVIAVDVDEDGSAGETLHKLQEQLIDLPLDKLKEIQQLYASLDTKKFNSDELMQYSLGMDAIKAKISEVESVEKRRIEEEVKAQKQALNNYLKEYGNAEEKRAAIAAEYDEKIRNARTEGDRLMAQAQKEQALNAFDTKQMQENFNFEDVFNNLGNLTLDRLNTVRDQLREMLTNNDLDFQNYKAIAEQIDKVNEAIIDKEQKENEFLGFRIPQDKEIKKLKEQQTEAIRQQLIVYGQLAEKQMQLDEQKGDILNDLNGMGITKFSEKDITQGNRQNVLDEVASLFGKGSKYRKIEEGFDGLYKTTRELSEIEKKKKKADDNAEAATKSLGEALKDVRARVGKFAESLEQINANIQSLPGLMDSLGLGDTKAGEMISGIASGANDAMGAMADFSSGNYVGAAMKAVSAIDTFGETFGAWSHSNRAEVEAANERLSVSMDINSRAVDRLTEVMKKQSPEEAFKSYERAVDALEKKEQAARQQMENNASMYDGGHSLNYDLGDANGVIPKILRLLGKRAEDTTIGALINALTAKDWNKLEETEYGRSLLEQLGMAIKDAEDEGNYNGIFQDIINYMDNFSKEAYDSLKYTFQEAVVGVSLESFKDKFKSALLDMSKSAEDFSEDFTQMMYESLVNSQIETAFKEDLEGLYSAWVEAMQSDNTLNPTEIAELAKAQEDLMARMQQRRDDLAKLMGIDQESTERIKASLDTIKSAFSSLATDTEADMEKWGKDLKNNIINNLIESMLVGKEFEEWAKEWSESFNTIWNSYQNGEMSQDDFDKALSSLNQDLDEMATETADKAQKIRESLHYAIDPEDLQTVFSNLHDTFLSTLMSMEGDAESFRKSLEEIMIKDLIDKQILGKAFTINDKTYETFDKYLEDWNKRYSEAVQEGNQAVLDALLDEVTEARGITIDAAEELRNRLMEVAEDDTFKKMSDSWTSTLMDMTKTADDWAKSIGQTMAQRIIEEMIVPTMIQPLLDNLQSVFNTAMDTAEGDWSKVLGNEALKASLEDIKEQYPKIQGIIKNIMDAVGLDTTVAPTYKYSGFSNLRDAFLSTLSSMSDSAEDWAKAIGEDMSQQMAQAYIDSTYGEQIDKYQEDWQKALESGNTDAMAAIKKELEALYETMGNDQALQKLIDDFREFEEIPNLFADMRSSFVSSLMNMQEDTESFMKSMTASLTEKMVDDILEKGFQSKIEELGEEWRAALEAGDMAAIDRMTEKLGRLRDEMGAAVDPLLDAIRDLNKQTDTTFSSMTDSWVSALMNMEGTAEEFAENVGKTMAQKIITELVAPIYIKPVLDEMQEAFDYAMAVEGATIQSVMQEMKPYLKEIEDVYNEILPMRDEVYKGFNIAQSVEEAAEEVQYALGDMKSNFTSSLMDMKNTTEDFSKDISKILAQNFIENFVLGSQFDQQMEYWQQQYESIIGSGMSEDERKRQLRGLRDSIAEAKESYVDQAMAIQELFGLTTEDNQTATMNMSDKITYDQADQLLGINLAQELTLEQILATLQGNPNLVSALGSVATNTANNEQSQQIAATLLSMAEITRIGNDNILTQIAVANSHLQMIRDYAKTMRDEIVLHLGSMDSKLTSLRNL